MPIRVAIVEDSAGIIEELEQILAEDSGCTCVCSCRNVETALRKIPPLAPDVIIMDINLAGGSGIDATARLKRMLPQTQIMMFTIYEEAEKIYRALEAGASGYLLKRTTPQELLRAVHEIKDGGVPMTGEVARKVIQSFRRVPPRTAPTERLTIREEQILELLAKGYLSKEIAHQLSVSVETVNSHLKHIYEKLHVRSRTEAVIKYMQ
jgi:DNA-binding NarL/FixJ family response regulator